MLQFDFDNLTSSQLSRAAPQLLRHPLDSLKPQQFCKKIKQIMSFIISTEHNHQGMVMELIEECAKRKDNIGDSISQFLKVYVVGSEFGDSQKVNSEEKSNLIMTYFSKMIERQYQKDKQNNTGLLWQTILESQKIIKSFRTQIQSNIHFDEFKIIKILLFNSAVGYCELNMYEQALRNIRILQGYSFYLNLQIRTSVAELKAIVFTKMGKKSILGMKSSPKLNSSKKNNFCIQINKRNFQVFFLLTSKSKLQFTQYINQLSKNSISVSLGNAYNICLLCKKYQLYHQGIQIMQKILQNSELIQIFRWKCLILLSQMHEASQNYNSSIECLNKIQSQDIQYQRQIKFKLWELEKKIKIKNHSKTCSTMTPKATHRYKLLENLQIQLEKLTHQSNSECADAKSFTSRKIGSNLYTPRSQKQSSQLPSTQSTLTTLKKIRSRKVSQARTSRMLIPNINIKTAKSKKTVRFHVSSTYQFDDQLLDLTYQCQEKIQTQLLQKNTKGIISEIDKALAQFWTHQKVVQTRSGYKFMQKCVNWYRQINQNNSAVSLLTKMVSLTNDKQDKIEMLYQLNDLYHLLNDDKKIISVNLQLVRLGQLDSLNIIAEQYLLRQKYTDAIKYSEQYFNLKPSLYAEIKLAHAYSKQCTFMKKAIDMLNNILFENKTNCIFRKFCPTQTDNIQNAVLLLTSIYIQSNGFRRAQEICQNFVQTNYSAYPIYHMLGVINLQINDPSKAFQYFINALKLKPNHLPSLVQAVKYVQDSQSNNYQIIQIVRKAFAHNHRSWEILLLLVDVLGGQVKNQKSVNLKGLIECALAVEDAGGIEEDLLFEAEVIWLWALELIEKQESKYPVSEKDQLTVLIRLGEINLLKGHYICSQKYFTRILSKLSQKVRDILKPKSQDIKLYLKILDKLTFLKLQQDKLPQALNLLEEAYQLAKSHLLFDMIAQIKKKRDELTDYNEPQ